MNFNPIHVFRPAGWPRRLIVSTGFGLFLLLAGLPQGAQAGGTTNIVSFTNTDGAITIENDYTDATPYPSANLVTGIAGTLQKVTVTLYGLSDPSPSGIDILLAGPAASGQAVELMYNAGAYDVAVANLTITVDDTAAQPFPTDGITQITNGAYQPSGVMGESYNLDPPAPPATTNVLAGFIGTTLEGTWSLYVYYEDYWGNGSISGWSLTFYLVDTPPTVTTLAASAITPTNATLNASVTPNGGATAVYFRWGPTTAYGHFSATNTLAASVDSAQAVAAGIIGLIPGSTNHYQAVAVNSAGTTYGGDMTLVTPALPPTISPVANQFVNVGAVLVITNTATDANVPARPLSFSLDASDPAGAIITGAGVFEWAPTCEQGSTTNVVTIWAVDNGTPKLSNSVNFTVTVSDCVRVSVGSSAVLIGSNTCVPVSLLSTVSLTNLNFSLVTAAGRFTNWTISATNGVIGATTVQETDTSQPQFNLAVQSGQGLLGATLLGSICVDSLPVGSSEFATLEVASIAATTLSDTLVGAVFGEGGRVTLIAGQPLLDMARGTNHTTVMTLYGNPGTNYEIEVQDQSFLRGLDQFDQPDTEQRCRVHLPRPRHQPSGIFPGSPTVSYERHRRNISRAHRSRARPAPPALEAAGAVGSDGRGDCGGAGGGFLRGGELAGRTGLGGAQESVGSPTGIAGLGGIHPAGGAGRVEFFQSAQNAGVVRGQRDE